MLEDNEIAYIDQDQDIELPSYKGALETSGFEAPGGEFAHNPLSLASLLPKDETATYYMRMQSRDWIAAHILPDDILVVDTGKINVFPQSLLICYLNNEVCLRRIRYINNHPYLTVDNSTERPVAINYQDDFQIFGTVSAVFRNYSDIHKII